MNERAKWAYLNYSSIQSKIDDGTLDSYDVIYTKDTHENYVISPDLEPWAVRSRIYVFNSEDEANTQLNINTDTYVGQIVSIIKGEVCKGYIVNKNQDDTYYVEQISPDNIDYNNLGNRPIENLVGTLGNTIIITALQSGTYKVKGQYKILDSEETIYLSADGDLFLVEETDQGKCIKRFTKDTIEDFVLDDNGITKKTYITDEYLNENGYTTTTYVDTKVAALETTIQANIENYVENIIQASIENKVTQIIESQLDIKIDEKIEGISNDIVEELFTD